MLAPSKKRLVKSFSHRSWFSLGHKSGRWIPDKRGRSHVWPRHQVSFPNVLSACSTAHRRSRRLAILMGYRFLSCRTARTILFGRANQRAVGQIGRGAPRNSPFGRAQRDRTASITGPVRRVRSPYGVQWMCCGHYFIDTQGLFSTPSTKKVVLINQFRRRVFSPRPRVPDGRQQGESFYPVAGRRRRSHSLRHRLPACAERRCGRPFPDTGSAP